MGEHESGSVALVDLEGLSLKDVRELGMPALQKMLQECISRSSGVPYSKFDSSI
ncbi:hypothetical protein ACFFMN_41185 [Planobispora siamensis]|uniref:FXSXX-COOH protein n=1 Tax=Planobispora siamensis TaxID=936338 RepID=A0A8J3SNZ8_9ACTN|nr:hypothetical protein [Planobispora siamensis]GIH95799.1 hypothetical protein Psi01_64290 [Planobispora siamensis]